MSNTMTTEETFKFLELYQAENCLWNIKNKNHKNKNVVNDAWKRIADTMGIPVHELKKKKESLLTTFRVNLKKRNASIRSGAGVEDVYQPIWIFYDVMAAFLKDIYEPTSVMNSEEKIQPDWYEGASTSDASDNFLNANNNDNDCTDIPVTPQKRTIIQTEKRRTKDPPELKEASRKMDMAFSALNDALMNKQTMKEEDECDFFCKMLAKQIKEYPKFTREKIMYEIHGVMMNSSRRYNTMQDRANTVSSPSRVILRPSTHNRVYLSTSPYPVQSRPQNLVSQHNKVPYIISQEIIAPETRLKMSYENSGKEIDDINNNTDKY